MHRAIQGMIQGGDMGWATQEVIRLRTPAVIIHSDDAVALTVRINFVTRLHSDDIVGRIHSDDTVALTVMIQFWILLQSGDPEFWVQISEYFKASFQIFRSEKFLSFV